MLLHGSDGNKFGCNVGNYSMRVAYLNMGVALLSIDVMA
jgi:hypothetical protein